MKERISMDYKKETSGRCHKCEVRFVWPKSAHILLKDAFCPRCGRKLQLTTHMWKGDESRDELPRRG